MRIEFDTTKRDQTLAERGLDFARACEVFAGQHLSHPDTRQDYAEDRYVTTGWMDRRVVVMVWTSRGEVRRIISMRKANEREIKALGNALD